MTRLSLGIVVLLCACGGPPPEPETPPPAPKPMPEPNRPAMPSAGSSDALLALPPDSNFVLRLELDRLRQGPVFGTVTGLSKEIGEARQGLAIVKAACGVDPTQEIGEIALAAPLSFGPQGPRIDPGAATLAIALREPGRAITCLQNFLPVSQSEVSGTPTLMLPNGAGVQARDNLLLYASPETLERAAKRIEGHAPLAARVQAVLDQHPSALLMAYTDAKNPFDLEWANLVLDDSTGDVKIEATGLTSSKEAAEKAAATLTQVLERAEQELEQDTTSSDAQELKGLLDTVRIEVADQSLAARLTIPKRDAEHFFSQVLVGVIAENSKRYVLAAKTAEARDLVMQIALKLSDYATAHKNAARRFPPSAPLSPATVPKNAPVLGAQHFTHPSWKAIGFAPREAIYFSYEFVTSKDGKSVEVIARGDLDGDGITSKYSVPVTIENGEPKVGSTIKEENPLE